MADTVTKKRIWKTACTIIVAVVFAVSFILLVPVCTYAAEGYDQVAGSSEMAEMKDVGKYGMTPIYGASIKSGEYEVDAESSSSFFSIYSCDLTVKGNKMKAVLTIDSTSYECVYMGKAKDAAKAPKDDYIFADEKDYRGSFTIPVEALNTPIACAAFSKKEEQWYDRNILIDAASLPDGALKIELPDYNLIDKAVEQYDENKDGGSAAKQDAAESNQQNSFNALIPAAVKMEDDTYSIEVNMIGGSGRASVSSPTWFIVKDGKAYARLLWSSSHYDYMKISGIKYENESTDGGNSTFTIPVAVFDQPIRVIADTTAMGDPVEIEYELTFYEDTINSVTKVPQEAAKRVIYIALIIIVVGGVLNLVLKRRKKQ
ncbi:MAG: hypothetical protein IJH05_01335 [Firmicutes bacterium]|nr:hypothetical protein [Bacillota bacterium]